MRTRREKGAIVARKAMSLVLFAVVVLLKHSDIRAEPTTRSKIIVTLRKGGRLVKIGDSGTWVNVRLPSGETELILKPLVKDAD